MIKNWQKIRTNTFFKLGVTVAGSYVMYLLAPFLLPILLAIALSFALYPLVNMAVKITVGRGTIHLSRVIAIALVLIAFLFVIFAFIGLLILPLFGQINELLQQLPSMDAVNMGNNVDAWFTDKSNIPKLPSSFDALVQDILSWAMGIVGTMLHNLLRSSLEIVTGLIGLVIVPFLSFYFLKDWRELRDIFIDLFNYEDQEHVGKVLNEIGETLSAYVNGLGKLCLLSCFCVSVGLACLGVNYALVFGFIALFAELIPVVGSLLGAVPAVFVAYGQDPALAYQTAFFYIVYYQIDANVIMPRLMGSKINIHPVVLIISVLLGAKLFGILGMVFAIPVAAVYKVLYTELWHVGESAQANEN